MYLNTSESVNQMSKKLIPNGPFEKKISMLKKLQATEGKTTKTHRQTDGQRDIACRHIRPE